MPHCKDSRKQNSHLEQVMEPSEIVNVLARASELQSKIDGAIERASRANHSHYARSQHPRSDFHDDAEDEPDGLHESSLSLPDVQKLSAIRDALFDLQDQLDSLQAIQKKQKFEREDLLVELEERRKSLIKKLREYNGTEWEIVQEAHAFVGEPVQKEDDLVLPPYQSSVRDVQALGDGGSVGGLSKRRQSLSRRTSLSSRPEDEEEVGSVNGFPKRRQSLSRRTSLSSRPEDEEDDKPQQAQDGSESPQPNCNKSTSNSNYFSGFMSGLARLATQAGEVLRLSAKSAFVVASVMFTLSQLEPHLKRWSAEKASKPESHQYGHRRRSSRPSSSSNSSGIIVQNEFCPPGKVLLIQDGVQKCFVKERVEAPFKEVVEQPDASYGYG